MDPRTGEQLKTWEVVPNSELFRDDLLEFLATFSLDPKHKNPIPKIPKPKVNPALMSEEDQIKYAMRQSLGKSGDYDSDDAEMLYTSDDAGEFFEEDGEDAVSANDNDNYDDSEEDEEIEIIDERPTTSTSTAPSSAVQDSSAQITEKGGKQSMTEDTKMENIELTIEDKFAAILPKENEEPPAGDKESTRIQFRLGDGSRFVRRFKITDTVTDLFAFIKKKVPDAKYNYFSLTSERKKLIEMLDNTIDQAGLKNSSILVEILD